MRKMLWLRTILGENRVHNSINLLKKKGYLIGLNDFRFYFNREDEKDVKSLFGFSIKYHVIFSGTMGYWHYKDNIITTPDNIKFNIKMFDSLIFSETFLSDIHFSDFDLNNKIVIQAGGFIGDTALYYASRGAKIYSFEPDINSYELALKNIRLNIELSKNIVMENYAIGRDEEIDFPVDPNGSGGSSAYATEGRRTTKIQSKSISTVLYEFNIQTPYLLDLDIKGKEFEVIRDTAIQQFDMVRIEYSSVIDNKNIGSRDEIINKLRSYGFNKIRVFKHNELPHDLNEHGTIEAKK